MERRGDNVATGSTSSVTDNSSGTILVLYVSVSIPHAQVAVSKLATFGVAAMRAERRLGGDILPADSKMSEIEDRIQKLRDRLTWSSSTGLYIVECCSMNVIDMMSTGSVEERNGLLTLVGRFVYFSWPKLPEEQCNAVQCVCLYALYVVALYAHHPVVILSVAQQHPSRMCKSSFRKINYIRHIHEIVGHG